MCLERSMEQQSCTLDCGVKSWVCDIRYLENALDISTLMIAERFADKLRLLFVDSGSALLYTHSLQL